MAGGRLNADIVSAFLNEDKWTATVYHSAVIKAIRVYLPAEFAIPSNNANELS
jgi:hypothetical protein